MSDLQKQVKDYQRTLFEILDEFLIRLTGRTAPDFSTIENFSETIHRDARDIAKHSPSAYPWVHNALRELYSKHGVATFRAAKQLGGLKLVHGGQHFTDSHLRATQSSLLYSDTVLILDPVASWVESERKEERFRNVLLLRNAHALLHLKPLVDADLPGLPILVFPSWEKALEENDPHTRQGINQLAADTLARFIDPAIETYDDAVNFARKAPDQFAQLVERHALIVAPGGVIGAPISESLTQYERETETWRSPDFIAQFRKLPASIKLMLLLTERIAPQFHLLENSKELIAHPLLCVEQQSHYFKIVSQTNSDRLSKLDLLSDRTIALVKSLGTERLGWLSEVPLDALVEIRSNSENFEFRKLLDGAISRMHASAMEDIDKVTAEVCLEIDQAMARHERCVREIDSKYSQKHVKTGGTALAATACALLPSLAPFVGPALPFAVAAKFGWDVWNKRIEKQKQAKSLMGVLVTARAKYE